MEPSYMSEKRVANSGHIYLAQNITGYATQNYNSDIFLCIFYLYKSVIFCREINHSSQKKPQCAIKLSTKIFLAFLHIPSVGFIFKTSGKVKRDINHIMILYFFFFQFLEKRYSIFFYLNMGWLKLMDERQWHTKKKKMESNT